MRKACLLLIAALGTPGWATPPISKTEIRALSDRDAKRQVMAQLSDLLLSSSYKGRKGQAPTRPLSDLWFYTRPRGTTTQGVCLSNTVVVHFRPVAGGRRDADTPVGASSIEVSNHYHLLAPVDPDNLYELDAASQLRADEECGRIDPRGTDLITAPDEDTLVNGIWLLRQAQAATGANPTFAMVCNGFKQPCSSVLATIDPAKVESVDACPSSGNDKCYEVEDGSSSAELRANANRQLGSVKIDQLIIIGDERAD